MKRGRPRALTPEQEHEVRCMYHDLNMRVPWIARRMDVSASTIAKALKVKHMDQNEYQTQLLAALEPVPEWLRGWVETQAYDRGHSAGYDEVLAIAKDMAFGIATAYEASKTAWPKEVPAPRPRSTHTYVTLEVPDAFYAFAKERLLEAGYQHALADDGALDMQGIALIPMAATEATHEPHWAGEDDDPPGTQGNPWKDHVIDHLVIAHILTAEHETNPEKALHDLLAWEAQVALDPAVSDAARALRDGPPSVEAWWNLWCQSMPAAVAQKLSIHDLRRMYEELVRTHRSQPDLDGLVGADPGIEVGATQHGSGS